MKEKQMELNKLQSIIERKNERLERDALNEAEFIIEQIASRQELITRTQDEISQLRTRLVKLEVKQLNSQTLLGEQ